VQQVTTATVLPVLVSPDDRAYDERHVLDEYFEGLMVGYTVGSSFGEHLLTWRDLDRFEVSRRELRRLAAGYLDLFVDRVDILGQPPALMLSFNGMESSVVLADAFWDGLAGSVPGDVVIGVPARDVVILTGSRSPSGIAKARRAVDRVFFAGGEHLLLRDLLIRRGREWDIYSGR
jgi:uncharacterized protein YtpQ (UPF0354 family)